MAAAKRKGKQPVPAREPADAIWIAHDGVEFFSPLMEAPDAMVCIFRADTGTIVSAGKAFRERFGITAAHIKGARVFEMLPAGVREKLRQSVSGLTPAKPLAAFVHRTVMEKGSAAWLQWQSRGFFDADGLLCLVLTAAHDIEDPGTPIECVREFDAYYQLLIDNTSNVVYFTDPSGIIRYISDTMKRVTGWKPEEVVGTLYMNYVHPDDMMSQLDYMKTVLTEGIFRTIITRIRTRDGEYRYARIESRLVVVKGSAVGVVGIISHAPDKIGNEYQILRMLLHLLSKNERRVLMLFAEQKSRRLIARAMNTVPEAIDTYVRRIKKKLGTEDIGPILEMIRMYPKEYFMG